MAWRACDCNLPDFLRIVKICNNETWRLLETVQTIRGPRQRIISTLGKLPEFDVNEKVGLEGRYH